MIGCSRTVWNGVFSGEIPRDIWCAGRQSLMAAAAAAFLSLDLAAFLSGIKFWHFGRKQARDQGLVTRLLHHFNNVFIWCCWPFLGSYHFPTSRFHSSHKYTLIDDFFFQRNNAVEKTRHFFAQQTLESRLLLEIWGQDKWWCGKKVF